MAEFTPPDGAKTTSFADFGQVPKVSETTGVKGPYGQNQSWRNGLTNLNISYR